MSLELDIPSVLPVEHLSSGSIESYLKCPEAWRRKYIEREYEPPSGKMLLGSAVGAALALSDHEQIDTGARLAVDQTADLFSDEWEERTGREEVDYGQDKPGDLKDSGVKALRAYERDIAPSLHPVTVEQEFRLDLPDVEWGFQGYLDLEEADGAIVDRKVKGKRLSQADADCAIQPTPYLLYRRSAGNPAPEFRYDVMVRTQKPYAERVTTTRTDAQLDQFVDWLYRIAAEINWRLETDNWQYAAPGAWWCGPKFCGYWSSCPAGGLHRSLAA